MSKIAESVRCSLCFIRFKLDDLCKHININPNSISIRVARSQITDKQKRKICRCENCVTFDVDYSDFISKDQVFDKFLLVVMFTQNNSYHVIRCDSLVELIGGGGNFLYCYHDRLHDGCHPFAITIEWTISISFFIVHSFAQNERSKNVQNWEIKSIKICDENYYFFLPIKRITCMLCTADIMIVVASKCFKIGLFLWYNDYLSKKTPSFKCVIKKGHSSIKIIGKRSLWWYFVQSYIRFHIYFYYQKSISKSFTINMFVYSPIFGCRWMESTTRHCFCCLIIFNITIWQMTYFVSNAKNITTHNWYVTST